MAEATEASGPAAYDLAVIGLVRAVNAILDDHYDGSRRLDPHHKVDLIDALADLRPHVKESVRRGR